MREIVARLGWCMMASGATICIMDRLMLHPIWSYGMAIVCVGALVFLIDELERL